MLLAMPLVALYDNIVMFHSSMNDFGSTGRIEIVSQMGAAVSVT